MIYAPLTSELTPLLQRIEVATSIQIPSFQIIGLPAPEVAEARERVRAAIDASELEFPRRRVIVNLSPASVRKRGTGLDLAMALAILEEKENQDEERSAEEIASVLPWVAWGELGLDGRLKGVGQPLRALYATWKNGIPRLLVSAEDYPQILRSLALLEKSKSFPSPVPRIVSAATLAEAWHKIHQETTSEEAPTNGTLTPLPKSRRSEPDRLLPLSPFLERLLGVSTAGRHHLLLVGPKGTGKSQALEWMAALQPELPPEYRIHQLLMAELRGSSILSDAPVRRVGAQVKPAALVGSANASIIQPGEFALAHGGLLIADEFPEWSRDSRESFREPLERGAVILNRVQSTVEFPCRFTVAATGNLCPCGGWPDHLPRVGTSARCICKAKNARLYLDRLSGPVLDRIDIVHLVADPPLRVRNPKDSVQASLSALRERITTVRENLDSLFGQDESGLSGSLLENLLQAHPGWSEWLDDFPSASLRSRHKILRVAISYALWDYAHHPLDLSRPQDLPLERRHFQEAFQNRPESYDFFGRP